MGLICPVIIYLMPTVAKNFRVKLKKKIVHPVIIAIKQGLAVSEIALTLTLGITISSIPLFGVSTVILTIIALRYKLNLLLIQAVNYAAYPVQILIYVPLLKLGHLVFNYDTLPESATQFIEITKTNFFAAIKYFGKAHLFAIITWLPIALITGALLYPTFKQLINSISKQKVIKPT